MVVEKREILTPESFNQLAEVRLAGGRVGGGE
jgi:hypothetical protein